jgi:hypothetical protein
MVDTAVEGLAYIRTCTSSLVKAVEVAKEKASMSRKWRRSCRYMPWIWLANVEHSLKNRKRGIKGLNGEVAVLMLW